MSTTYGKVTAQFWTGDTGRALAHEPPLVRLVALYLVTGPAKLMTGLYFLPVPLIVHDVGCSLEEAQHALARLRALQFAFYDQKRALVFVVNMAREQIGPCLEADDKRVKNVRRLVSPYLHTALGRAWLKRYARAFHCGALAHGLLQREQRAREEAVELALLERELSVEEFGGVAAGSEAASPPLEQLELELAEEEDGSGIDDDDDNAVLELEAERADSDNSPEATATEAMLPHRFNGHTMPFESGDRAVAAALWDAVREERLDMSPEAFQFVLSQTPDVHAAEGIVIRLGAQASIRRCEGITLSFAREVLLEERPGAQAPRQADNELQDDEPSDEPRSASAPQSAPIPLPQPHEVHAVAAQAMQLLSALARRSPPFRVSQGVREDVNAILAKGYSLADIEAVIRVKARQWLGDAKMTEHLVPRVVLGKNFERYLEEDVRSGRAILSVEEAWKTVEKEFGRTGTYRTPTALDPVTLAAVRRAGWKNICSAGGNAPQLFAAAYREELAAGAGVASNSTILSGDDAGRARASSTS